MGGTSQNVVSHFVRLEGGVFDPLEELGGSQLQAVGVGGCPEQVPDEANVFFQRTTPGALGFGLIEAIPDADLLALELAPPSAAVSGRVHWVTALEDPPGSPARAGRFGWKAILPTVLSFSGDAARNELGLTNRLVPTEPAPNGNTGLLAFCDPAADPEDGPHLGAGKDLIDRVTDFQRYLAPPPQTPRSGTSGEALFRSIGCADCHVPAFTTSNDRSLEGALRNVEIRPYSDFLLHDMGQLADFPQGDASASEFRTTPLWGLRRRITMLHDGRVARLPFAAMIDAAVAWHDTPGSEGASAAAAYAALLPDERQRVVAFLDTLGRREFDHDGDRDVDDADLEAFLECWLSRPTPDDPCAVSDFDQDGRVNLSDWLAFWKAYERG